MRIPGLLLIALLLAIPIPWFVALAREHDPVAIFSQFLGSEALIVMAVAQVLATRMRGLEALFGGLDRIYILHKWLGVAAMALILAHDTIDAELDRVLVDGFWTEVGETLGEISLYGLLMLVTLTVATFVPYHFWRWTHRFIGGFFAFGALHFLLIDRPFELATAPGAYVSAFCVIGVAAYVAAFLRNTRLAGAALYEVAAAERRGDLIKLVMRPKGRAIRARPGQFAFFKFADGLGEPHPFTLSRAPNESGEIACLVKRLGDFTEKLYEQASPGMTVAVTDGFGAFLQHGRGDRNIWIAAGVGVTPFAAEIAATPKDATMPRPTTFFYCVADDAPHVEAFEARAASDPNFEFHLIKSSDRGRLSAAEVAAAADGDLSGAHVWFCGPDAMRRELSQSLKDFGLRSRRFHYEAFEIRSGIGLRRLAAWALDRALR